MKNYNGLNNYIDNTLTYNVINGKDEYLTKYHTETPLKIEKEIWNNIVFPEFDVILKSFLNNAENEGKDLMEQSKIHTKNMIQSAKIWNNNFNKIREYKGKYYYINLIPSPIPSASCKEYINQENISKDVSRFLIHYKNVQKTLALKNKFLLRIISFFIISVIFLPILYILLF